MSEPVPGVDLERLLPWFQEHVAEVSSLEPTIVGHGPDRSRPRAEARGMRAVHHGR